MAVVWILFLELLVATYVYTMATGAPSQPPFSFPTTTTTTTSTTTSTTKTSTTTSKVSDKITVSAAIANDTLMMKVHNLGPNSTELLTLESICTPKFQVCYSYSAFTKSTFKSTFVLPATRTFLENVTRVCVMPIPSCKGYLPIAGSTYYYRAQFTYSDGSKVVVPVTAKANNTWSPYPTAVLGVNSTSLTVYPANLTGILNFTVGLNDSLPYASWKSSLDAYMKPSSGFSGAVLTNESGCEGTGPRDLTLPAGALNYTAQCSAPVTISLNFSTVTTGVAPGSYYALVVQDTTTIKGKGVWPDSPAHPFFAFAQWVQSTKG